MRGRKLFFPWAIITGATACLDWHIQMKERSVERSAVYLFHIITENISNFHHECGSIPWQPLIELRHPSGEMMVLDRRQALGVRLRDERRGGGWGVQLITLLLLGTEHPSTPPPLQSQEASSGPVWEEEDPARHITSLTLTLLSEPLLPVTIRAHGECTRLVSLCF